jgi:hypothetical protein
MSCRCKIYRRVSFHSYHNPGAISKLRHLSWSTWSVPSSHKIAYLNAAITKRSLSTHEAAKIAQKDNFRHLCESEVAVIPFERRRDAAKVKLAQAAIMDTYTFPDYRLKKKMDDPSKTPLLLVACGSFSPITFLHLRMFIMAGDYVKFSTDFEIVGGYLSPVSDAYKKAGLASAEHRYVVPRPRSIYRHTDISLGLQCASLLSTARPIGLWSIPGRLRRRNISPLPWF